MSNRKTEIVKMLLALASHYPNQPKLNEATLEIYAKKLDAYPLTVTAAVFAELADREKFFPPWATVKKALDDVTAKTAGIPEPGDAWAEALSLAHSRGREAPPWEEDVSHPIVLRAIRGIGGWVFLCDRGVTEPTRARFFELIRRYRDEAIHEDTRPELSKVERAKFFDELNSRTAAALESGEPKPEVANEFPKDERPSSRPGFVAAKDAIAGAHKSMPDVVGPKPFEVGADMTDEEFEARKKKLREKLEGRFDEGAS